MKRDLFNKRLLCFVLIFTMILGCLPMLSGCSKNTSSDKGVTILYTNDIHGNINNTEKDDEGNVKKLLNYGNVAAMKKDLQAAGQNVILVDAGDHIQGTVYTSFDEGAAAIDLMNAAKYDLATFGNHEFDFGTDRLMEVVEEAEFPYVSCNLYSCKDNSTIADPYKIIDAGGVKVAFIGITTPETFTSCSKSIFYDENGNQLYDIYGLHNVQEMYDHVQSAIDEIGDSADYVVALSHLGVISATEGWKSYDLIANTTGLDAVIDGHSHTVIEGEAVKDASGNNVTLTQTGCYLHSVGKMRLENGTVTTELVSEYENSDAEVDKITESCVASIEKFMGKEAAYNDTTLYALTEDGSAWLDRNDETNLGDLIADSYYYHFKEVEELDCDVAFINGGAVRENLYPGAVTYSMINNVTPFGNMMCMVSVTGQTLLDALEYSCACVGRITAEGVPDTFGGFLQVAGMKFDVDSSVESTVQSSENGWIGAPTGKYKVSNVQIYNKEKGAYEPIDLQKKYNVVSNNYILRESGNGYNMFQDTELVKDYVGPDIMLNAEYMQAFALGSDGMPHISTANSPLKAYSGYLLDYENQKGSGRINIK